MKWLFMIALLALSSASAETILEDETNDVSSTIKNWDGPVDLVALGIEETEDTLTFSLEIGATESPPELIIWTDVRYQIDMTYGEKEWSLRVYRGNGLNGEIYWSGSLASYQEGFGYFRSIPTSLDGTTLHLEVPRGALVDHNDQQLYQGRELTDVSVWSNARQINFMDQKPTEARDQMPDDGSPASWMSVLGPRQSGPATLVSEMPFRASNGEATTYAFEVQLASSEPRMLGLRAENIPSGWNVVLPTSIVNSEDNLTIPVLAQVPFRHLHGETETFSLIAENGEDYTELQMGVRYLDPAEISGHHDTAYLMGTYGGQLNINDVVDITYTRGLISTDENDPQGNGKPIQNSGGSTICGDTQLTCERFYFYTPLYNGFDANIDDLGSLQVRANYPLPALDSHANVEITHVSFGEEGTNYEVIFEGTSELSGQTSGDVVYEVPLTATPYADRIDVQRGQYMSVKVELQYQSPRLGLQIGDDTPSDVKILGGTLQLPLNDYHDDVSAFFDGIPSLQARVEAATQTVNDGETRLFPVQLENIGSQPLDLHLELTGEWASLVAPETLSLAAGEMQEIHVAMSPTGASNGDKQEAILTIHGEETQEILTLAAVVTDEDVADDSETVASLESKETPFPYGTMVFGVLGTMYVLRRR